ncbi:MAG: hypothetical protein P8J89_01220 [Phycisphaerales bacterium]|nr:hypothetical protein [Phycisphaerales bacterium]
MMIFATHILILLAGIQGFQPSITQGDLPTFQVVLERESPRQVHLGTIGPSGADFLDTKEGWFDVPSGECLAIIRDDSWRPRPSRMRVIATDGQVFPGSFIGGDRDSITIRHPWMDEMRIPLDDIKRVEFRPSRSIITSDDQDHVLLTNGDVVTGFIESIEDPITIEVARDDMETFEIPLERIAELRLAGESVPPEWPRAWFVDGLQVSVPSIRIDETGQVKMASHQFMTGGYGRLPGIDETVAIVMDGERFTPLPAVDVETVSIDPVRRVNPDPERLDVMRVFDLSDLRMSGPVQYEFSVKRGFNRFRTVLERPRNSDNWSSPDVEIKADDQIVWSGRVDGRLPLDIELPDSCTSLVVRIACGEHGPIHCGVVFRHPVLSIQSSVGDASQLLE